MTITVTAFTPLGRYHGFAGVGAVPEHSLVPRGDINFDVIAGAVTAGGTGNEQNIRITNHLPHGFAYAFAEMSCQLYGTGADNWDNSWENHTRESVGVDDTSWVGVLDFSHHTDEGEWHASSATQIGSNYTVHGNPYSKLIVPNEAGAAGTLPGLFCELFNTTQDDAAATISFHLRFRVYDILQSYNSPINTPILVR